MISNGNGNSAAYQVPDFLKQAIEVREKDRSDPADRVNGAPPNWGAYPIAHVDTFQGHVSTISNTYRDYDEAIQNSLNNARFMRNDTGVMECMEARQRAAALLDWSIIPEDDNSLEQKQLCEELTKIMQRIPRFLEYRMNLLHAIWYGKYAIQHRYGYVNVSGRQRLMPKRERENVGWMPVNGDKLVFRFDAESNKVGQWAHQVGIRVGAGVYSKGDRVAGRWKVEATDRGMAYFPSEYERKMLTIHKHMVEDGAYEDALSAGMVHGLGVRSRIYWDWVQKQESLAFLIEYLERSAGGIELWKYPAGNDQARRETEASALNTEGARKRLLIPIPPGDDGMQYGVEVIEPGMAGIDVIQNLLTDYYGHRIKRYILGQVLTTEAEATGLGSGVAEAHMDSFLMIVSYDAQNLEETITEDLLRNLQVWNFPKSQHIHLRFKIATEDPDVKEKLEGMHSAWEMGARIKEQSVLDAIGEALPTDDDRVLENPAIQQAQQMGQMGGMFSGFGPGIPKDGDGDGVAGDKQARKAHEQLKEALQESVDVEQPAVSDPSQDTGERVRLSREGDVDRYRYVTRNDSLRSAIDRAAAETDTSPSEAQKASGNYRKGQFSLQGMQITLENPKGSERSGKSRLGVEWSVTMPCHYGYIKRTEGHDGDHVDCFIGPDPESEVVFVIDQQSPGNRFDEHKVMIGFTTERDARAAYLGAYSKGWTGLRAITALTMPQFRAWLETGEMDKPIEGQVSRYAKPKDAKGQQKFPWITIGGHAEGDKKHVDGTPVQIEKSTGRIVAGPKALEGKDLDDLDKDKRQHSTDDGDRQQDAEENSITLDVKQFPNGRWYAMADLPDGGLVTRSDEDKDKAIALATEEVEGHGFTVAQENASDDDKPSNDTDIDDDDSATDETLSREEMQSMGVDEINSHLWNQKNRFSPTFRTEDWGSMRGQGKRVKGMIRGAMSGRPQGKKTYLDDLFGGVPDLTDEQKEELIALNGDPLFGVAYLKARSAGLDHDEAVHYGIGRSEGQGARQLVDYWSDQQASDAEPSTENEDTTDEGPQEEPAKSQTALFDDAIDDGATPREAAKAQKAAEQEGYEYARESAVGNAGEDLKGSARHKVNAWRSLEEAEANGTADDLVTRDNLLKNEPHELMQHADHNPITTLAMHLALKAFPAKPGPSGRRRTDTRTEEEQQKDRSEYLEAYRSVKSKAEQLAESEVDPNKAVEALDDHVVAQIRKLRSGDYMNRYNSTANNLIDLHKKIKRSYRPKGMHVLARVAKWSHDVTGGELGENTMDTIRESVKDILEGKPMSKAGNRSKGPQKFKPADAYVKHAEREGGKDVSDVTSDPNQATEHMVDHFGMRGVQWGNSVTDDERKHHASKVVEAFTDLLDVIGLRPEDASLGGKLGLAIGARGHGSALAHYEPGSTVINLTRKSGVGALAHEWGHGFDHMLTEFKTSREGGDYMSGRISPQRFGDVVDGRREIVNHKDEPIWAAMDNVRSAFKDSGFDKRLGGQIRELVDKGILSEGKAKYWRSEHEKFARCFERYIQRRLEQGGRKNTYLTGVSGGSGLWPTDEEVDSMAPAFDGLFEAYRQKHGITEKYSREELRRHLTADFNRQHQVDVLRGFLSDRLFGQSS